MIPYGKQNIDQTDIDAVIGVLESDFLTQGPVIPEFERVVASQVGAQYAVSSNSATSSLHMACLALGLKPGDEVWTSPITFVASANCAHYCGATVDFVDIDPDTYNLSTEALEEKLKNHKANNKPLPKIVIPVHLSGLSCDMKAIKALSETYGFKIIEDASHAIGAFYQDTPVGCCQYSDITVFSFHPVKIITTGEGGMAVTNEKLLVDKMALLRSHGVTRDISLMENPSHGDWYYEQIDLGFNYRMTDIQAALGVSQIKRLINMIEKRQEIAELYNTELSKLPIKLPNQPEHNQSSRHLYIIQVESDQHNELFRYLKLQGVGVNLHYIPVYKQPYFIKKYGEKALPNAELYYKKSISIPVYFDLKAEDQKTIIKVLNSYYE